MTRIDTDELGALKKWNWGPLFLGPIWALANNLSFIWMFLSFLPGVNIYLAFAGNRLAFPKSKIKSIDDYMAYQNNWSKWGLRFFWITLIFGVLTLPFS